MSIVIDKNDIDLASTQLFKTYGITVNMLHKLYSLQWHQDAEHIHKKLHKDDKSEISSVKGIDFCRLVVTEAGYSLFSGSNKQDLRKKILGHLSDKTIDKLYNDFFADGTYQAHGYKISALAQQKWVNGKRWAKAFVKAADFPEVYAGIPRGAEKTKTIERIKPKPPALELREFQIELKNAMKNVLTMKEDKTRCIVTLPTGCGKTRVAVESFIEWMQPRFSDGRYLIWIAQSEELCDQAAACIIDAWEQKEFVEQLTLIRFYQSSKLKLEQLEEDEIPDGGVVVASINQLYKRLKSSDPAAYFILERTGAMIIDEAHRSVTPMYSFLFEEAKKVCKKDLFPICGLTATPGRNPLGVHDTNMLVDLFQAELIKPQLEHSPDYDKNNPLSYFKKHGYLAKAKLEIIKNNASFKCDEKELEDIHRAMRENDFNYELDEKKKLLKQFARDKERNYKIIQRLIDLPSNCRSLVYTCTVEHARYLSSIMNMLGRSSYSVSSDTPTMERRKIIQEFKDGRIQFIFNYSVLTTGFDAPKTDTIVLCRPILSDILYEQIVGRGMRGPEFKGTEHCLIIDFEDTVQNLGLPLAYSRYEAYWETYAK